MPENKVFDTTGPVAVTITLAAGDVVITATDRGDAVVEVRPSDENREQDVKAAEATVVEYAAGRLLVKAPKARGLGIFGRSGSIDVSVGVPTGSRVLADTGMGTVRCIGSLGECQVKTGAGDIQLDESATAVLETGAGAVVAERIDGTAEISTGTGRIRVREVTGAAEIKNSNGDNWVGRAGGTLRATTANGNVVIDAADGPVTAKSACGDVRVLDVARGSSSLRTAYGDIEVGIRTGSAARLDVSTDFGRVRNELEASDGPGDVEEYADVQARTSYGDVLVRRS